MKYASFLRHASLAPPFDNYDTLSLYQLDRLARQDVNPPIDPEALIDDTVRQKLHLDDVKTVFCATSLRARQTSLLAGPASAKPLPLLDEIRFTPSMLVSPADYDARGMQAVRDGLFEALLAGDGAAAETVKDIYARIAALERLFSSSGSDILCVTHGFFMRFLELYFNGVTNPKDVTLDAIHAQPNHPNLHGFRVRLD